MEMQQQPTSSLPKLWLDKLTSAKYLCPSGVFTAYCYNNENILCETPLLKSAFVIMLPLL